MASPINVAILGASGYTGVELIRLLHVHPHVHISALTGDSQAGKPIEVIYPHLTGMGLPALVTIEQVDFSSIDLVFCCLPHGTTQTVIAGLPSHVRVIDLSADFRLHDVDTYKEWYGHAHQTVELQKTAVYGLTEHARAAVKTARLVANPGCYPTASQLPLIPLLRQKIIRPEGIIIDAKSGVSGAGRSIKQSLLYCEIEGGFSAYSVGAHRHAPEIEQGLSDAAGCAVQVGFTPHLVPMSRGILATIYATLTPGRTADDALKALGEAYANETFVQILPMGAYPSTAHVRGSNTCMMSVFADRVAGRIIIVSVIDNLVKGASGQAVQNMNVMYGFAEDTGLKLCAVYP